MNKNQQIQALLAEIDLLLATVRNGKKRPSKKALDLLDEITSELSAIQKRQKASFDRSLAQKLDNLIDLTSQGGQSSSTSAKEIVSAIEKIKLEVPTPQVNVAPPKVEVTVPEVKVPPIRVPKADPPTVHVPDTVKVQKPAWLPSLKPIETVIGEIRDILANFKLPRTAREPVSVRLSDGEKFYRALGGGGGSAQLFPFAKEDGVTKQATLDEDGVQQVRSVNGLVPEEHDYVGMSWTGSNLTGLVFKDNGADGQTVATLTLGYDSSDNLTSITKT